uniref:ELMO domain-containing protein n=1 Tax=Macrostomum lignano TaxID=282301 RepID=A0A1I8J2R9_9PLAT
GGDRGKDELISAAQAAEAASAVAVAKRVEPGVYPQFESALAEAAIAVASHDRLCRRADAVRRVAFSNDCAEHKAKLAKLWTALCPGQPLSGRICKQWGDIGFQGDDPQTDFRGMGMLGLEQLLFLASRYPARRQRCLARASTPGFPFAVAGINIGHLVWRLLAARKFRKHFYNLGSYELDDLHRLFCCLFLRFADFWQRQGASVMEFNSVKAKFKRLIKTEAARSDCLFRAPEES